MKHEAKLAVHSDAAPQDAVKQRLDAIESGYNVKIVFACESGSRAWGFPSRNSDYDVRFIYVRPIDWYLTIDLETRRDVIETPIDGLWDVNGWDLRKALRLLRKSNPPLLEWLQSPIVYKEESRTATRLRELLPKFYNPKAACYHYVHMAQANNRGVLRGEQVKQKKYFYVLRPVLACRWIERELGVVPTEFEQLLSATVEDPVVLGAIRELLERKREGEELGYGPRVPAISNFLESELDRLTASGIRRHRAETEVEELSRVFRESLFEVWGADS